jgi:hypothetical protein
MNGIMKPQVKNHALSFEALQAAGVNLRNDVTVPIGSNTYPVDIWNHFNTGKTGGGSNPPTGALVFYSNQQGDRTLSHVAISVGGGRTVSTTDAAPGRPYVLIRNAGGQQLRQLPRLVAPLTTRTRTTSGPGSNARPRAPYICAPAGTGQGRGCWRTRSPCSATATAATAPRLMAACSAEHGAGRSAKAATAAPGILPAPRHLGPRRLPPPWRAVPTICGTPRCPSG